MIQLYEPDNEWFLVYQIRAANTFFNESAMLWSLNKTAYIGRSITVNHLTEYGNVWFRI